MDLKDEIIQRVVKERLGEPNGIYKRHIHQDLVKEMMEQYHQSQVNNSVLDGVSEPLAPKEVKSCMKADLKCGKVCKEHCGASWC